MNRSFAAALVSFALLGPVALVPTPTPAQESSGITERVSVRLVQRTIFALDREGRPVTDLRPEELRVKDDGRRYEVSFLDPREREPLDEPLRARVHLDAPGGPAAPVESSARTPHYYVVLLDLIHRPTLGLDALKAQLRRTFGDAFRPEELVSVVSFTGDIHMEQPFTNDPSKLEQALDAAYRRKASSAIDPARRIRGLIRRLQLCLNEDAEGVAACVGLVAQSYRAETDSASRQFLRFLQGGVRYASGLDGRKALLVVSQGGPLTADIETRAAVAAVLGTGFQGLSDEEAGAAVDRIVREANESDVALHFVSSPPGGGSDFSAASGVGPSAPDVRPLAIAYRSASEGMRVLARETGGRHLTDDSFERALTEIIDLERGGYTLGYYVDRELRPGDFHRVRIGCSRPGVSIVTARGYIPPRPDGGEIELRVTLARARRGDGDLYRVPFRIDADPRQIGYRVQRREAAANFTVETAVRRPGGRTVVKTFHFLQHSYDKQTWKKGNVEPVRLDGWIELPEGEYELVVVLRNPDNARSGRVTSPVRLTRR